MPRLGGCTVYVYGVCCPASPVHMRDGLPMVINLKVYHWTYTMSDFYQPGPTHVPWPPLAYSGTGRSRKARMVTGVGLL